MYFNRKIYLNFNRKKHLNYKWLYKKKDYQHLTQIRQILKLFQHTGLIRNESKHLTSYLSFFHAQRRNKDSSMGHAYQVYLTTYTKETFLYTAHH